MLISWLRLTCSYWIMIPIPVQAALNLLSRYASFSSCENDAKFAVPLARVFLAWGACAESPFSLFEA